LRRGHHALEGAGALPGGDLLADDVDSRGQDPGDLFGVLPRAGRIHQASNGRAELERRFVDASASFVANASSTSK